MNLSDVEIWASAVGNSTYLEDDTIDQKDITRWQELFDLSPQDAEQCIREHRKDSLNRCHATDDHWETVRDKYPGHDKESYEYLYLCTPKPQPRSKQGVVEDPYAEYILKLEGPLKLLWEWPEELRSVAGGLEVFEGEETTDEEKVDFVIVGEEVKEVIELYFEKSGANYFWPMFIRYKVAPKKLSTFSRYPTLGIESTLSQYRLDDSEVVKPTRNEYPVWYFFYGTLAEPDRLTRLLSLDEQPQLEQAHIQRGVITSWGDGKYQALVDGDAEERVPGSAFSVRSKEDEDILRKYETDKFEVVRSDIFVEGGEMRKGLTFRFSREFWAS